MPHIVLTPSAADRIKYGLDADDRAMVELDRRAKQKLREAVEAYLDRWPPDFFRDYAFDVFIGDLEQMRPPQPEKQPSDKKAKIAQGLRWEVFKRDDFRCRSCGSRDHLRADHIIPESRGGPTELSNLQTLCATCNSRKGSRHVEA